MTIKPGPHGGFWVMDGDKVYAWCYNEQLAQQYLTGERK